MPCRPSWPAPMRRLARCSTCAPTGTPSSGLDNEVSAATQLEMLIEARRLVERSTRWLVRANPYQVSIAQTIRRFQPGAELMAAALPEALEGSDREAFDGRAAELEHAGVPAELARRTAGDAVDARPVRHRRGGRRDRARARGRAQGVLPARLTARSQLAQGAGHRAAARQPLAGAGAGGAARRPVQPVPRAHAQGARDRSAATPTRRARSTTWSEGNGETLDRALGMVADIRASRIYDNTTLPVALREIRSLLRGTSRTGQPVGSVTMAE